MIHSTIGQSVGPGRLMSTADFNPQIKTDFSLHAFPISENPPTPIDSFGHHPNSLVAGGLLSTPRSAPRLRFPGPGATGYIPPDCDMGVGPTHVVAVVNTHIAFYRKSDGLKTFEQEMDNTGFFNQVASGANGFSDPKVFYDPVSTRWFVCILEFNFSSNVAKVDLAVSDDSNPNGNWFQYGIDVKLTNSGTEYWMDYPALGCNKDAVAVGGNMFGFAGGYFGASIVIIPKGPLLTGGSFTTHVVTEPGGGTDEVCRSVDPTVDKVFGMSRGDGTNVKVFALTNLLTTPVLTITSLAVPTYGVHGGGLQAGGGHQLDGFDSRVFTSAYRAGKIVGAHGVDIGGQERARWYQIATNSWPTSGLPTLVQSGNINVSGADTHMPAINVNAQGDIGMMYTRSSPSINADLCISSHRHTDPNGSMGAPVLVAGSPAPYGGQGGNRWGDFFSVAIDPVDSSTFWGFGMTGDSSGNWVTWVNSWVITTGGSNDTPVPANNIATIYGNLVGGDLSSIQASDGAMYTVDSILVDRNYNPPGNGAPLLGHISEVQADFAAVPTGLQSLKVVVKGTSLAGVSGMIYAYNFGTARFDFIQSFSMSSVNKLNTISVRANAIAQYVGPGGVVSIRVRAINPVRSGRPTTAPPPFEFGADQISLLINTGN